MSSNTTKRITELRDSSYRERLSILNSDTIEYRRLSCDLTLYYKIFNNLTPWSPIEYCRLMPPYSLHSIYHDFNIRKLLCLTNSFENDFFNRCVSAWNSWPSSLIKSKSVTSFKYNLKSIDLSSLLNCVFLEFEFIVFLLCSLICKLWCHISRFIFIPCDYQRYMYLHIIIVFKLLLFHVSWSF